MAEQMGRVPLHQDEIRRSSSEYLEIQKKSNEYHRIDSASKAFVRNLRQLHIT